MLYMPTPEVLEAQANDLEQLAAKKEEQARGLDNSGVASSGTLALYADAAIFREEATAKRAKAERMRKAPEDLGRGDADDARYEDEYGAK